MHRGSQRCNGLCASRIGNHPRGDGRSRLPVINMFLGVVAQVDRSRTTLPRTGWPTAGLLFATPLAGEIGDMLEALTLVSETRSASAHYRGQEADRHDSGDDDDSSHGVLSPLLVAFFAPLASHAFAQARRRRGWVMSVRTSPTRPRVERVFHLKPLARRARARSDGRRYRRIDPSRNEATREAESNTLRARRRRSTRRTRPRSADSTSRGRA